MQKAVTFRTKEGKTIPITAPKKQQASRISPSGKALSVKPRSQLRKSYILDVNGNKKRFPEWLVARLAPLTNTKFKVITTDRKMFHYLMPHQSGEGFWGMNYYAAKAIRIDFPYDPDTILVAHDISDFFGTIEHEVREIGYMKRGLAYIEAHSRVLRDMNDVRDLKAEPRGTMTELKKIGVIA